MPADKHNLCFLTLLHACVQVNYKMDEQWQLWSKVGIRKLVSIMNVAIPMTEQERCIVERHSSDTFSSASANAVSAEQHNFNTWTGFDSINARDMDAHKDNHLKTKPSASHV